MENNYTFFSKYSNKEYEDSHRDRMNLNTYNRWCEMGKELTKDENLLSNIEAMTKKLKQVVEEGILEKEDENYILLLDCYNDARNVYRIPEIERNFQDVNKAFDSRKKFESIYKKVCDTYEV